MRLGHRCILPGARPAQGPFGMFHVELSTSDPESASRPCSTWNTGALRTAGAWRAGRRGGGRPSGHGRAARAPGRGSAADPLGRPQPEEREARRRATGRAGPAGAARSPPAGRRPAAGGCALGGRRGQPEAPGDDRVGRAPPSPRPTTSARPSTTSTARPSAAAAPSRKRQRLARASTRTRRRSGRATRQDQAGTPPPLPRSTTVPPDLASARRKPRAWSMWALDRARPEEAQPGLLELREQPGVVGAGPSPRGPGARRRSEQALSAPRLSRG